MDNASKNAGDMIANLQLKYNRGRQAAITNELVDIITGMSRGWSLYLQSLNCLFQVPVRSERQDVDRCGRRRVLGCRLAHVIFVPPVTIVLNFYPTFLRGRHAYCIIWVS